MSLQVELRVSNPPEPLRHLDGMPVYPMGHAITVTADFTNLGAPSVSMEDPKTSQKLLLLFRSETTGEETVAEVHPGSMDVTGEMTAPPTTVIQLRQQETISVPIHIARLLADKSFGAGEYELSVEFLEFRSSKLRYGVEFSVESVPTIIEIALDETADLWVREEAVAWLQKLPNGPLLEIRGEENMKVTRETLNRQRAASFLDTWPTVQSSPPVSSFFESNRLR